MRRLILAVAVMLALAAGPAYAATKEYTTGNINVQIPAGGTLERAIAVPDTGAVTFVRAAFRLDHPRDSDLTISLVSPRGTEVPLVVRRGTGANFGAEKKGCRGTVTVLDSDMDSNPIAESDSPFTDNPYRAEGNLKKLYGEDAKGRWTLKIADSGTGAAGALYCFELDISRDVPETLKAGRDQVKATATFTERNFQFTKVRLKVVRGAGKTVVDSPVEKLSCRDCGTFRPTGLEVRDLDGGEPEVILEMYSGGAHCCSVTLILRYDPAAKTYRGRLEYWGNYGYRLADLDRDGLPEFSAADERFVYTYTAYAFSAAPIQIWRYRQGKLVDVTRDFPALIGKDAASLLKVYEKARKEKDVPVRGFAAAYVADLYLLGQDDEAKQFLQLALKRGDLNRGEAYPGPSTGARFVQQLTKDLRTWGYIR